MKSKIKFMAMVLLGILLSINQVWGVDINMTATSVTQNGITVAAAIGSGGTAPAYTSSECRLYASNTLTVSSSSDNITAISFVYHKQGNKTYISSVTANTGTYTSGGSSTSGSDNKTDTWSGSAKSITFTMGNSGQRVLVSVSVTTASGGATKTTVLLYPSYTIADQSSSAHINFTSQNIKDHWAFKSALLLFVSIHHACGGCQVFYSAIYLANWRDSDYSIALYLVNLPVSIAFPAFLPYFYFSLFIYARITDFLCHHLPTALRNG